jgi:TonB dependent receptor
LLGFPSQGVPNTTNSNNSSIEEIIHTATMSMYYAAFIDDHWHVMPKLTLDLGLRWEDAKPTTERHNRLDFFDPTLNNPVLSAAGLSYPGSVELVASGTRSARTTINNNPHEFSPRVGLSYAFRPNTIFSMGYGIFYTTALGGTSAITNLYTPYVYSNNGGITPGSGLSNPFPNGIVTPPGRNANYQLSLIGTGYSGDWVGVQHPYVQQYNVAVQHQIRNTFAFTLAWAGSKGTHLGLAPNLNQIPDADLAMGGALLTQVPNPFYNVIPSSSSLGTPTVAAESLLARFPQYTSLGEGGAGLGDSNYNALELTAQKRLAAGASINLSYTWAKLLSDVDTGYTFLATNTYNGVQDNNNLKAEKSLSGNDVRNNVAFTYIYDIPVGRGRKYLANASKLVDYTIGEWGVEGDTSLQSGQPMGFQTNSNNTHSNGGGSRPNVVAGCNKSTSGSARSRIGEWFNTACFTQPAPYTFGDETRFDDNVRVAGVANWDASVYKNFPIAREGAVKLQFRAEAFNLWNRVQFGFPGTVTGQIGEGEGVVSSQANNPRLIQFALRIDY